MAVIIREEKIIEGKDYTVKVYKTQPGRLITQEEKIRAEKLDNFLSEKMKEIEREMKNSGLLRLKGKRGEVLKLWYEVGKRLNFVDDKYLVPPGDRDFVWRALYDHAGRLAPGPLSERAKRDPSTSHFSYCYRLSKFPWEFVGMAGDWTSWCEFFDRSETKGDPRIIEWLGEKAKECDVRSRQNWLRPLTKAIHNELGNKDTLVFTKDELFNKLEKIFSDVKEDEGE
jgi:hypothetical protein